LNVAEKVGSEISKCHFKLPSLLCQRHFKCQRKFWTVMVQKFI